MSVPSFLPNRYSFFFFSRMTTTFSKQKLAEAQEKKAKGGLVSGLISRKRSKVGDLSKENFVVTPPSAHSLAKCPASLTSSLEVIASAGEETSLFSPLSRTMPMLLP